MTKVASTLLPADIGPVSAIAPGFTSRELRIDADTLSRPANPSIACIDGTIWMLVRLLSYVIEREASGRIWYRQLERLPNGRTLLRTRNLLVRLDDHGEATMPTIVAAPEGWPTPRSRSVLGFEDSRLFAWKEALWALSSIRETHADGRARMILTRIDGVGTAEPRHAAPRLIQPGRSPRDEKNWMPLVDQGALRIVYTIDPMLVLDEDGSTVAEFPLRFAVPDVMRGGPPLVAFDDGWLGLEHEFMRAAGTPYYFHRFFWLDRSYAPRRFSRRFFFTQAAIEFAAGLCWSPDGNRLIVSFGVDDQRCRVGTFDPEEIRTALCETWPVFDGSRSFSTYATR
jgi:hypothetical protein